MRLFLLFISFILTLSSFKGEEPLVELVLKIEGIKTIQGNIFVSVFNEDIGFPEDAENAIRTIQVEVNSKKMKINMGQLPKGIYAIALIHDVNSNQLLDKNFFGIPKEPFGFSNINRFPFGAPSFDEAEILLSSSDQETVIKLLEF